MTARRFTACLLLLPAASPSFACSPCRALVAAGIFDGSFPLQLFVMLLPVLSMVAIALLLCAGAGRGH